MGLNYNERLLISELGIAMRVDELAAEAKDYYGPINNLLLVGILTGAYKFLGDFSVALHKLGLAHEVGFMGVSSYENEQVSSGAPRITLDLKRPIRDKRVLLVEDIVDTGFTMEELLAILSARNPDSLDVMSLLSKAERREVNVPITFTGFIIPNRYVYGYGIDDGDEYGRSIPEIVYRED